MLRWLSVSGLFLCSFLFIACSNSNNPSETTSESPQTETVADIADASSTQESSGSEGTSNNCPPNLPKPSNPCLTGCGNELRVGMPCTRGGGECSDNPKAILCTGDFNQTTDLLYCTKPCVVDEDCGSGAKCTGDPNKPTSGRGCIPAACL